MDKTVLLINIVLDNSASMKGERFEKFKKALKSFIQQIKVEKLEDKIEFSITAFKGFEAYVFKSFEEHDCNLEELKAAGIPFVNDAINKSLKTLFNRVDDLQAKGIKCYKPWTILLLNGENADETDVSADVLIDAMKNGKLTYFPFSLTDCEYDKSLMTLKRIKTITTIKDEMYKELFGWMYNLAKSRIEKAPNEPITLNPKQFEGWIIK